MASFFARDCTIAFRNSEEFSIFVFEVQVGTPQIHLVCSDESVKDRLKINIGVN